MANNNNANHYNAIHPQDDIHSLEVIDNGDDGVLDEDDSSPAVVITVEDAIEHLAMGPFQYIILLAAGLCFAADAMEIVLLSFLSVVLQKQWQLTPNETALITSVLFFGACFGTLVLGPLADQWGRRPVFVCTAWIISIASLISAAMSHYWGLLIMIFIIGFGIGGLTVPFDILAEFLPSAHRGSNLLMIEYCWTFGVLLVVWMAQHTLSQHNESDNHHHDSDNNWRYLVVGCACVCCGSAILGTCLVPESPRWLVTQGKGKDAVKILQRAARWNGLVNARDINRAQTLLLQDADNADNNAVRVGDDEVLHPLYVLFLPHVQLIDSETTSEMGHTKSTFADLFQPRWRRTTIFLWGTWAAFAFGYYGAIQAITRVFARDGDHHHDGDITNSTYSPFHNHTISSLQATASNNSSSSSVHFDYQAIYISSSAEFVGTTLAILGVDRIGRIPFQMVSYATAGIAVCLLCVVSYRQSAAGTTSVVGSFNYQRWTLIGLGFITRVFEMSATCVTWVSTAEILTTEVRTTGHAAANAVARIGALLSPFLIEGSTQSLSLWQIGVVMLLVHSVAVLCVSQLPETKGRRLGHADSDELQLEVDAPLTQQHVPELLGEYHPTTNINCDDDENGCAVHVLGTLS